jgi:hypothetical protein
MNNFFILYKVFKILFFFLLPFCVDNGLEVYEVLFETSLRINIIWTVLSYRWSQVLGRIPEVFYSVIVIIILCLNIS